MRLLSSSDIRRPYSLNQHFRTMTFIAVMMAVLTLSACLPETTSVAPNSSADSRADQDTRSGRYDRAARNYERLANTNTGAKRDAYLLDASRAWFNHGESVKGLTALRKVRGEIPKNDPVINMLLVTDKLINGKPQMALRELSIIQGTIGNAHRPAYLELRGRALTMVGDAPGLISTFGEREAWLTSSKEIEQNQRLIWLALRDLGRKGHQLTTPLTASSNVAGWLELARLYRDHGRNPSALRQQLGDWQSLYSQHSANALLDDLSVGTANTGSQEYPQTVALLLPISGRLGGPGSAVRDGFISAYLDDLDSETRPMVNVYDTGSLAAAEAYRQAVKDGAQFIVGPLSKKNVEEIVATNTTSTTTLALNYLADSPRVPSNFFQFSLAPEHESVAIAKNALNEGMTRAIALVPETDLGSRLLTSFQNAFEVGGGQVIDVQSYNPAEKDFGIPITQLLNLNSSKSRHRELSSIVGASLEFEPRRRQDAQFVFLVAAPKQGRLLRPQLNYHYANDLPIFSTASIYQDDATLNRKDLEGVVFADAPWLISDADDIRIRRQALSEAWPQRTKQRGRLFAMGMDAYSLIPMLHGSRQPLAEGLSGVTGLLGLEPGNRIVRALQIATVKNGRAIPYEPITETELFEEDFSD